MDKDQALRMAEEVELPISEAITHVIADDKEGNEVVVKLRRPLFTPDQVREAIAAALVKLGGTETFKQGYNFGRSANDAKHAIRLQQENDSLREQLAKLTQGQEPDGVTEQQAVYEVCMAHWGPENGVTIDAKTVLELLQSHREAIAKKDAALQACVAALEASTSETIEHDAYFKLVEAAVTQAQESMK